MYTIPTMIRIRVDNGIRISMPASSSRHAFPRQTSKQEQVVPVDGSVSEHISALAYPVFLCVFACGVVAAIYAFAIKRDKPQIKREGPKLIGAVCETAGQFAYIFAIGQNAVAAAPIISCYCVLSVVWSAIFLKERLSWKHYLTIAITVVGIAILGAFGGE